MNALATIHEPTAYIPAELEAAANETGLVADGIQSLKSAFGPHFVKFHELAKEATAVKPGQPKAARVVRLELRAVRIAAEKTRTALKEDSLRRGKAIDGINAVLVYQLAPLETRMQEIEDAEEIAERKRRDDLQAARSDELRPFIDPTHMDLGGMPDGQWSALLIGAKAAHQAKIDADAKAAADRAEQERIAREEAARKEEADRIAREQMQAENARLAKVAEEERAKREESERAAAAQREKERAEQDAKDRAAEAARLAAEKAATEERQRLAAAAEAEKRKAEIAQAEVARLAKESADRAAAETAAAAKAKAAPDREKLAALATGIRALPVPTLVTEAGAVLVARIKEQAAKFAAWVEAEAGKL